MAILQQNIKYHFLLFFISPILGLVYGLRTKSKTYIRWSIFGFVVIYGALLHPSHLGDGADHFENVLAHYQYLDFYQFWEELIAILSFDPSRYTNDDPYLHILSYFIGTILNAPNLFFVGVAIVFAYFYSGAIVMLLSYINWNSKYNKFYFIFFLILFMFWQNPGNMQSIRNTTAQWLLIYAVLSYHQTKRKKYLFLALLPPLIHIGYFALAIPFWIVLFSGYRKPKIYFIIFMVSVVGSNIINPNTVNDFTSQTEIGASKTKAYYVDADRKIHIDKGNLEKEQESRFYKIYQTYKIHYNVLTGLIIFMFFFLRRRGFGQIENTLFSYGLAAATYANMLNFNFAIYNRTWQIASILILALLVIFLSRYQLRHVSLLFIKVRLLLFIFCLTFVPYLFYLVSAFLNFTSLYILFMPIVMLIEFDMGISIRGFVGFLM